MLTYLRYALATVCFAASIGCLALWGWAASRPLSVPCAIFSIGPLAIDAQLCKGEAKIAAWRNSLTRRRVTPSIKSLDGIYLLQLDRTIQSQGYFATGARSIYFPLWYPALILALAGVASLRLGRRFTLRSAIIATTVVAGLLGMAVIL